jgi:hypothetical protein
LDKYIVFGDQSTGGNLKNHIAKMGVETVLKRINKSGKQTVGSNQQSAAQRHRRDTE